MIGKWQDLLFILQKFVTSEGCYTLALIYHLRLLLHFESGKLINFPYNLLRSLEKIAKGMQSGNASQVASKLYHRGLITILVKKKQEEKGITSGAFLKEFQVRSAGKYASTSTCKKRKAETSSPAKQKGESTSVQAGRKTVEKTPPLAKKRKTRTSVRKKMVSQGMNQSSSLIITDESPHVSPKVHNLSVLVDAAAHAVEDEENAEDDILLSTFVSRLRKRKMTPSTGEVQAEGHEDEEEQHIETLNNFNEPDIEALNDFEERGTKAPTILER